MKKISINQWFVALVFILLGIALLYIFVHFAEPEEAKPALKFTQNYSEADIDAKKILSEAGLKEQLAKIEKASIVPNERVQGRYTGTEGFYRTAEQIRNTFKESGLEITDESFPVTVPVTEYCEILGSNGKPLPGITVYPFEPSGVMTSSLPEEGVSGKLIPTESSRPSDLTGKPIEGNIILNNGFDCEWATMASMGVKAVLIQDDPAELPLSADDPKNWVNFITPHDVSFPRFYVRGPISNFANQQLTLRSKVTWQNKMASNILGVLRSPNPAQEALVITAHYDSSSRIPDYAPGGEEALSLASMLEIARSMSQYKQYLTRDVIFVAEAARTQTMEGTEKLLEAIDELRNKPLEGQSILEQLQRSKRQLEYANQALALLKGADRWNSSFNDEWKNVDPEYKKWAEHGFAIAAGEVCLERQEATLQANLAWIRGGRLIYRLGFKPATDAQRADPANKHPLYNTFLEAKKEESLASNAISVPFWNSSEQMGANFTKWGYLKQAEKFFNDAKSYEEQEIVKLTSMAAVKEIFKPYNNTLTIDLELYSGGEKAIKDLVVFLGRGSVGTIVEPQVGSISRVIREKAASAMAVTCWSSQDVSGGINDPSIHSAVSTVFPSVLWFNNNRLAFSIANKSFFPNKFGTPDDNITGIPTTVVGQQIAPIGKGLLTIACGNIAFKTLHRPIDELQTISIRGSVFTNADAGSQVPNHPMGRNTVVHVVWPDLSRSVSSRGIRIFPIMLTNPYGEYSRPQVFDFISYFAPTAKFLATRFDDSGNLLFYADTTASNSIFQNEKVIPNTLIRGVDKPVNIALFRASQSSCFQKGNPKTLNSYAGFDFVRIGSLQTPEKSNIISAPDSPAYSAFLPPDFSYAIALKDGSMENPEVQTYRAFMLNVNPDDKLSIDSPDIPDNEQELYGNGYLAADTPNLTFSYFDAAASMLRTNAKRLRIQDKYHMADKQMKESHARAIESLLRARKERVEGQTVLAVNDAGRALADATNNHPVIRMKIASAILGILWYLGLLIPFAFFFEKLVFGFTDIRKQLLASAVIFTLSFLLLQAFHPAFRMVASPMMILLGFLISLLALLVIVMVGGKFQQTIKDLRKREGTVEGADINRAGVIGTAFMLGLNNMRRRKVRTGLTCGTLVLITFAMICFTSVSSDVIEDETTIGRAPSNGIFRRDINFAPLTDNEISNLRQLYGLDYPIAVQSWVVSKLNPLELKNAVITLDTKGVNNNNSKSTDVNAAVVLSWNENQFSHIDQYLITKKTWFPRPPATSEEKAEALRTGYKMVNYVMLPDEVAKKLEISVADVDSGKKPIVTIRNEDYVVLGIFDSIAISKHAGLDGQSILPYDLNSIQTLGRSSVGDKSVLPFNIARLPGSLVILTNKAPIVNAGKEEVIQISCSIGLPSEPYTLIPGGLEHPRISNSEQRAVVAQYLERVGVPGYYAIDGYAYSGQRTRGRRSEGVLALIIPLILAALTVFNTMRGSVYERQDEIYVYNAVGIAPNHIFFMFMAEACVYAVIGALAGYLLSQIVGSVLTSFGLTTGLNMDYSSIETIWASVFLVAAVMLSTIIPAQAAAKMALPSDEMSWSVPQAEGDVMKMTLPFTFTAHDRVAVMSYFYRWLDANGEGSSGTFHCSPPDVSFIEENLEEGGVGLVPRIETTVWLKPYDQGVSQRMTITLPTDPETKEYIAYATIERLSGTMSGWERAVMPFLGSLRKQFLSWRAVSDVERSEMFAEAKEMLLTKENNA
ncbi:MAG: FtsX-like permease family protein [bacterium]